MDPEDRSESGETDPTATDETTAGAEPTSACGPSEDGAPGGPTESGADDGATESGADDGPKRDAFTDDDAEGDAEIGTESGPAIPEAAAENGEARSKSDNGVRSESKTGSDAGANNETPSLRYRFRHDMEGPVMWLREMLSSVAIVLLLGLLLFGVSGVWPPMVAVESGSMEPNMQVGDLVFVTEPGRFAPDAADNRVGVVTHEAGRASGYRTFGDYGSVVIYQPPGRQASPIIHRAMFHVEAGENWYDRADDRFHGADSCAELRNCPAPRSGFITLGDDNAEYDQANGLAEPVASEWILGVARARVPYLGYTRLITTGEAEVSDLVGTAIVSGTNDPNAGSTCVPETNESRVSRAAAETERAERPELWTTRSLAGSGETSVTASANATASPTAAA